MCPLNRLHAVPFLLLTKYCTRRQGSIKKEKNKELLVRVSRIFWLIMLYATKDSHSTSNPQRRISFTFAKTKRQAHFTLIPTSSSAT